MLHFNESFAGGWFGFRRTYGAVARFECASLPELETDWVTALRDISAWRAKRGHRATSLDLYLLVEPVAVWPIITFLTSQLLVRPGLRPPEFQNLRVEIAVFGSPQMEQYIDVILYSQASEIAAA